MFPVNVGTNCCFVLYQVLETALKIWGLTCISIESPAAGLAAQQPEKEEAFILNLQVRYELSYRFVH